MSVFTVRGAIEADISAVKRIADICFTDPWSEAAFASKLGSAVFKVVEKSGETVGFAVAAVAGDEAELYDIAVLPEFRGAGAASELFDSVLNDVKSLGAGSFYLEVRRENRRARAFYLKKGFCEVGVRKKYYKDPMDDAILMSLDLN